MTIEAIESAIILKARNRLRDKLNSRALPLFKIATTIEKAALKDIVDNMMVRLLPEAEAKAINRFMQKCDIS